MSTSTVFDPTDLGTLRPNEPSIREVGTRFKPLEIDQRDIRVNLPENTTPLDPYSLFKLYYIPEIIRSIVQATNSYVRVIGKEQRVPKQEWYETTPQEIYVFLAIRIYMTLHVENEIRNYWSTSDIRLFHDITKYLSRDRFLELHLRYRVGKNTTTTYTRLEPLTSHIQRTNQKLWIPGSQLAADEIVVPYDGRSHEKTTIPNKPYPTRVKIWAIAQANFLIVWNYHISRERNGPIDTKTPRELGGTKRDRKGSNKTQAVVAKIVDQLLKPTNQHTFLETEKSPFHVWVDNLFTSTRFLEYMRSNKHVGVSGTTRPNVGILEPILQLVHEDKNDKLPWGTKLTFPTKNGLIAQVTWKDQGKKPSLMMSIVLDGINDVQNCRKRPKQGKKKEEQKHKPFKGQPTAILNIPEIFDCYNNNMGPVDGFDHLTAINSGLRHVKRGAWQALEHWLLRTVLVNTYVIAQIWLKDNEQPKYRSQVR